MPPEELARLFDEHAAALELYVRQWTRDAADVVQNAFIRLAEQQSPPRLPVPWLYRVARNLAISELRAGLTRRKHERRMRDESGSWFEENAGELIDGRQATMVLQQLAADVLTRVAGGEMTERKDLIKLLEEKKEAAVVAVLAPLADYRRVLAELPDSLPREFGVRWKELCLGMKHVRASITLWPRMSAKIEVATVNAEGNRAWDRLADAARKTATLMVEGQRRTDANAERSAADIGRLLLQAVAKAGVIHGPKTPRLEMVGEFSDVERRQILSFLVGWAGGIPKAASRTAQRNRMKHLALAMHNFHNDYRGFPPAAGFDDDGKKLLSWRVYLLPYLGDEAAKLYKEFHLDEPWDSKHNRGLIKRMPTVFGDQAGLVKDAGKTRFVAAVGRGFVFDGGREGRAIREIRDGTSGTIMLVEAAPDRAVIWTQPEDLVIDPDDPWKGLVAPGADGVTVVMCDGAVMVIDKQAGKVKLLALLTRAGGGSDRRLE